MIEKIKQLLFAGVDGEALIGEISAHFYESLEDNRKNGSSLVKTMEQFETLKAFFAMDTENLGYDDALLLDDLMEDIEYALQYRFDVVEDSVKKELIEGKYAAEVKKEVRSGKVRSISILDLDGKPSGKLTEDEVEEFYIDAFREFDDIREKIWQTILQMKPSDLYHRGEKRIRDDKDAHHLLMDERDFLDCYRRHFDREKLRALFARSIYEAIHFHRRYRLELIDISDMPKDPDEEILDEESGNDLDELSTNIPDESEGVLEPAGDLCAEDFQFVYELMSEYTGHRVLPSDDENVAEAYWATYADDLGDMLGMYMIQCLEDTIADLNDNASLAYESLARFYHWNEEQRKDPEVILTTSDKISFALSDLQEKTWSDFNEEELLPYYQQGEKMALSRKDS